MRFNMPGPRASHCSRSGRSRSCRSSVSVGRAVLMARSRRGEFGLERRDENVQTGSAAKHFADGRFDKLPPVGEVGGKRNEVPPKTLGRQLRDLDRRGEVAGGVGDRPDQTGIDWGNILREGPGDVQIAGGDAGTPLDGCGHEVPAHRATRLDRAAMIPGTDHAF